MNILKFSALEIYTVAYCIRFQKIYFNNCIFCRKKHLKYSALGLQALFFNIQ